MLALTVPSAKLIANSNVERHGPSKLVVDKRSRIVQNDVLLCFLSLRHSNQAVSPPTVTINKMPHGVISGRAGIISIITQAILAFFYYCNELIKCSTEDYDIIIETTRRSAYNS